MYLYRIVLFLIVGLVLFSCSDDDDHVHQEHAEAVGFILFDGLGLDTVVQQKEGQAVAGSLEMTLTRTGNDSTFQVRFYDDEGGIFALQERLKNFDADEGVPYLNIVVKDSLIATIQVITKTDELSVTRKKAGTTTFRIEIIHGDHPDFKSKDVSLVIKQ